MSTTSSSYVWVEKLAWLRCISIQNTTLPTIQLFLKSSSIVTSCGIKYASMEYYGNYALTE